MIPNRLSLRGYHNFNANATTRKGSDVFSVIKMYKTHKLQISPEKLVQAMKNVRKDILATHLCRKKRIKRIKAQNLIQNLENQKSTQVTLIKFR